tara:strand:+ start:1869 stop:2102 length:234 start_codon:yes stop_codon:yes gene_type:complete
MASPKKKTVKISDINKEISDEMKLEKGKVKKKVTTKPLDDNQLMFNDKVVYSLESMHKRIKQIETKLNKVEIRMGLQ